MKAEKVSKECKGKVEKLLKEAHWQVGITVVKSMLMVVASMILITGITVLLDLINSGFPAVAGFATVIMLQACYVIPKSKKIGEEYGQKIKEVVEAEQKRQSEEG